MKYYFVGIKGSGMAGLALIIKNLGNDVRGADVEHELFTQYQLIENGIIIDSLSNMHYEDYDIIVLGNAFIDKFDFNDKKTITYQELLSSIVNKYFSIAICGSHGKTTTTNMIKHVLSHKYDIGYLVGDGQGFMSKNAKYFVFEACEHRDHFLSYHPNVIICTNIDYDHVEYFKNKKQYVESFMNFFNNSKDELILNQNISYYKKCQTYGTFKANVYASNIKYKLDGTYFNLTINKTKYKNLYLPFFGKHQLEDALACISCCLYLNMNLNEILTYLSSYTQATRRHNVMIYNSNVIIDDYGHHPSEIKATIAAIKQEFKKKKLIIVYHPDREKRLTTFLNDYKNAFKKAKTTYVLPFLNNTEESIKAINKLVDNKRILNFDDKFYKRYSNHIFLFTGSKDMNEQINKLKKYLM